VDGITTIIFDFGGVLGSDANSWTKDNDVVNKTGLSVEEIDTEYFKHWDKLKIGKEDLQEFFEDIQKKSKNTVTIEDLRELYHQKILLNEDLFSLAKKLQKKYPLYILANESLEGLRVKKDKFQLDDYFTQIFNSAELGLSKPDPNIFETVLTLIQTPAEHVLFIDDQERNVKAAKTLGIKSIHYTGFEKLIEELPFLSL
jgi:putative hydrolase of the HAD superfamily